MLLLQCTAAEGRIDGRTAMLSTGARYCCDACCCCNFLSFDDCNDDERNVDPKNCIKCSSGFECCCGWRSVAPCSCWSWLSSMGLTVVAADNGEDDDVEDGVEI